MGGKEACVRSLALITASCDHALNIINDAVKSSNCV